MYALGSEDGTEQPLFLPCNRLPEEAGLSLVVSVLFADDSIDLTMCLSPDQYYLRESKGWGIWKRFSCL
jgi:hypothetical protein